MGSHPVSSWLPPSYHLNGLPTRLILVPTCLILATTIIPSQWAPNLSHPGPNLSHPGYHHHTISMGSQPVSSWLPPSYHLMGSQPVSSWSQPVSSCSQPVSSCCQPVSPCLPTCLILTTTSIPSQWAPNLPHPDLAIARVQSCRIRLIHMRIFCYH